MPTITPTRDLPGITEGDDIHFPMSFVDPSGNPIDISGWTISTTVKEYNGGSPVIQKDVTNHRNATGGETGFEFQASETAGLTGSYRYDIQVTKGNGEVRTVVIGTLPFIDGVTDRTPDSGGSGGDAAGGGVGISVALGTDSIAVDVLMGAGTYSNADVKSLLSSGVPSIHTDELSVGNEPKITGFGTGIDVINGELVTSGGGGIVSDGLTARWAMDNGDYFDGAMIDHSGNGNTLQLNGTTATSGVVNQARSFDGMDDYGKGPTGLLNTQQGTVSLWLKTPLDKPTNYTGIIGDRLDSTNYNYQVNRRSTDGTFFLVAGGSSGGLTEFNFDASAPDVWHHLVFDWDEPSDIVHTYHNNTLSDSGPTRSTNVTGANIYIGIYQSLGGGGYFEGDIDEIRTYNRVLSDSERTELYEQGP